VEIAQTAAPDVILLDVRMPGINGVAAARRIRARYPNVQVLMLSTYPHDEYVIAGLRAGACGYLLKNSDSQRLLAALRAAAQGQMVIDPAVSARVVARLKAPEQSLVFVERLTSREREVLRHLAEGDSNSEIAARLGIREGTVKIHVGHILAKLGARDRTHAARLAVEWGLLYDE